MVSVLAIALIAVHTVVVRIPVVAIFLKFYFYIFFKLGLWSGILGKRRGEERVRGRERPNILNIVALTNYLATFDSQPLATLNETKTSV